MRCCPRPCIRPVLLTAVTLWVLSAGGLSAARGQDPVREIRVAAAADLSPVMPVFAQRFEQKTGIKLVVTTGSSGAITAQIENGAPVDIFLGADFVYPEKLVAAGLTIERAPVAYARGRLVLWARKDSAAQPISLEQLLKPQITRVALADQFHAPFGRAAMSALDRMQLTAKLQGKLVIAENVAQAGQFAESGNAQAAFVSLTLAHSEHFKQIGSYVMIPESQYPEIRQCAVILSKGHSAEATTFLDWLLSAEIQAQLPNVGLEPVR